MLSSHDGALAERKEPEVVPQVAAPTAAPEPQTVNGTPPIALDKPRLADVLAPVTEIAQAGETSSASAAPPASNPRPADQTARHEPEPLAPPLTVAGLTKSAQSGAVRAVNPMGSPLGLGLGRARVLLEGPRSKITGQSSETVSGRITGGTATRLVLYVNGTPQELALDQRSFQTPVALLPGLNRLRAVATTTGGAETEDVIEVEYVPNPAEKGIALASPRDGFTLGPDEPPLVVVEGELEDKNTTEVSIVANDRRIPVTARQGRFRQIVPIAEAATRVWVEARLNGGSLRRSEIVTVHAAGSRPGTGLLVMEWSEGAATQVDLAATWRGAPGRMDTPAAPVSLKPFRGSSDTLLPEAFYLGTLKPGVYTFTLNARTPVAGGSVRPTLYLVENGAIQRRVLRPVSLAGSGRSVVARVLSPQGVLWDQDDWFTGKSESADTITKFRFPEGITWAERKADL